MEDKITKKEAAHVAKEILIAALGVEKVSFNIPQLVTSYQMLYKGVLNADDFVMPEIKVEPEKMQ